jgi:predicted nuclease of predicted toxin-antitoxin system
LIRTFPGISSRDWWHSFRATDLALERSTDQEIWEHARSNGFAIVSKDSDFNQMAFLHGAPPKVIWLRIGNCTTQQIEQLLRNRTTEIIAFSADDQSAVLILEL